MKYNLIDRTAELADFADTAALLMQLDLVIAVDTSVAHLAGALGRPVWIMLPYEPDWRWLLEREDTPWYPTLRLFRQSKPGEWAAVFRRIATELRQKVPPEATARPLHVEIAAGELIDKITILEIKQERIADPIKVANVQTELAALAEARQAIRDKDAERLKIALQGFHELFAPLATAVARPDK